MPDPSANQPSADRPKLTSIEVARGVAATLVICHHSSQHITQEVGSIPLGSVLEPGHAAVDFFFVLSGFLILFVSQSSIGQPERIPLYTKKRLLRIFPIYWVSMAMFMALHAVSSSSKELLTLGSIFNDFFLWPRPPALESINGVSWSLSFEVLFYLLFAAYFVHLALGRLVFVAWSAGALLGVFGWINAGDSGFLRLLTSEYALLFPLGMAVAKLVRVENPPSSKPVLALGVTGLAVAWFAEVGHHVAEVGALPRLIYGIASAVTIYGLVLFDRERARKTSRSLLLVGECSYSIYLFHYIGIAVAAKAASVLGLYGKVPAGVLAVAFVLAGFAVGMVFGVLFERPLVRWGRRVATGARPPA